jgi:hypothetical protein
MFRCAAFCLEKDSSARETRKTIASSFQMPSPFLSDVDTKESSPMAVDLIYCHGFALFNVASTFFIGANTKHSAPAWRRYCAKEDRRQLISPVVISTVEVRPVSLQISTKLSQPQVEDQYNRGGFIVYNKGSIQRIIDRQLASSCDQFSGGQTGSQPPD